MSNILGLDLTRNISLFTVPVAFFAALVPHAYSISSAGRIYDNVNPRAYKDNLNNSEAVDQNRKQRLLRAASASKNGFETLGFYAAAVVAANQAGVAPRVLNTLTLTYTASRFAYIFVYVWLQCNPQTALLRTATWSVGIVATVTLYVKAGLQAYTPSLL